MTYLAPFSHSTAKTYEFGGQNQNQTRVHSEVKMVASVINLLMIFLENLLSCHEKYFKNILLLSKSIKYFTSLREKYVQFSSVQSGDYLLNIYCVPSMTPGPKTSKMHKTRYALYVQDSVGDRMVLADVGVDRML